MYGINRILRKYGHKFDIGKSVNFRKSQECYKTAIKELKECGKGFIKSAKEITEEGNMHYILMQFCLLIDLVRNLKAKQNKLKLCQIL